MQASNTPLTIIGDVGVDLVLGPLDQWPQIGTETVMDMSEMRAGGSAGNTALALGYLGSSSQLISAVGNDPLGHWLTDQMRELKASLAVCDAATSISVGILHTCGERTFFTTRGHLEKITYDDVARQVVPAPAAGSIALLSGVFLTPALRPEYDRLITHLLILGYQVAIDTGWPSGGWDDALRCELKCWLSQCDHILLSENEVINLAEHSDLSVAAAKLAAILKPGASLIVKTGAKGAIGLQHADIIECEAIQATIFDTIGAGDSFNAGYLLARIRGGDLTACLKAGCDAATFIISCFPRRQIKNGQFSLDSCSVVAPRKASL